VGKEDNHTKFWSGVEVISTAGRWRSRYEGDINVNHSKKKKYKLCGCKISGICSGLELITLKILILFSADLLTARVGYYKDI